MSQKITLISFDHWNYDQHIVTALQKRGITAQHIKIGNFQHKNIFEQIKNSCSKIFLNKNPKLIKRQEYVLEQLKKSGKQDQILVINPELIDLEYHLGIKKYTKKYIAYLYDSVARCPIEHLLNGVFDEFFSFDKSDVIKFGFNQTCNYFYFDAKDYQTEKCKQDCIYIGSIDDRIEIVNELGNRLKTENNSFVFYAIGKKAFIFKVKQLFGRYKNINFRRKRFSQHETLLKYSESNVIIDIVRGNQSGLSFRFFEAMALDKKIITNNLAIKDYDFYNPNNILVIDNKNMNLDYTSLVTTSTIFSTENHRKYNLINWVNNVFTLTV